jgi:hypothetical protein
MYMVQTILVIISALCIGFFAGTLTTALTVANKISNFGINKDI